MNCPACDALLAPGDERCPSCGGLVTPPSEGALAPEPALRANVEPLREIPGLRKKERTWKDEVRERMRHRRQQRQGHEELPLFRSEPPPASEPEPPAPLVEPVRAFDEGLARSATAAPEPDADLPLRPSESWAAPAPPVAREAASGSGVAPGESPPEPEAAWKLELSEEPEAPRAVERPARPGERALAALADLGVLAVLWTVVVYFAGRALRVGLTGLLPAWPALASYLAGLGLAYATYFTGTTGQTPGKMALGLRVVDTAGRPPGYVVALLRCAIGVTGSVALVGLAPVLFDPARRGLHDRLFRTRVVRH
jgi:uncharacterized RDD family membrane protein YckC